MCFHAPTHPPPPFFFNSTPALYCAQENAELLTEEGKLLAGLQAAGPGAGDEGDYDMRAYALRLEALLKKKHATTALLLEQIDRFKRSLEHEEMLSTMRGGGGQ
jgi:hypothetical protein